VVTHPCVRGLDAVGMLAIDPARHNCHDAAQSGRLPLPVIGVRHGSIANFGDVRSPGDLGSGRSSLILIDPWRTLARGNSTLSARP
jgi:hypothetical protein